MMMSDTCPEITDDVGSGYLEPGAAVVPNVVSDESQGACGCCEDGMSPQENMVCMPPHIFAFCIVLSALASGIVVASQRIHRAMREKLRRLLEPSGVHNPHLRHRSASRQLDRNSEGPLVVKAAEAMDRAAAAPLELEHQVPARYVRAFCGNEKHASQRWKATLKWRKENEIDSILNEPQPLFHDIRRYFPSHMSGRSRGGHIVVYEKLGGVDMRALVREIGVTVPMLLRHWIFVSEYQYRVLQPTDSAQQITIEDMKGVRIQSCAGKIQQYIKAVAHLARQHYVERCHKTFVVNAPAWFGLSFQLVLPFLSARTRQKIRILGSDLSALQDEIDPQFLPVEYGGTMTVPVSESSDERNLRRLVDAINANADTATTNNSNNAKTGKNGDSNSNMNMNDRGAKSKSRSPSKSKSPKKNGKPAAAAASGPAQVVHPSPPRTQGNTTTTTSSRPVSASSQGRKGRPISPPDTGGRSRARTNEPAPRSRRKSFSPIPDHRLGSRRATWAGNGHHPSHGPETQQMPAASAAALKARKKERTGGIGSRASAFRAGGKKVVVGNGATGGAGVGSGAGAMWDARREGHDPASGVVAPGERAAAIGGALGLSAGRRGDWAGRGKSVGARRELLEEGKGALPIEDRLQGVRRNLGVPFGEQDDRSAQRVGGRAAKWVGREGSREAGMPEEGDEFVDARSGEGSADCGCVGQQQREERRRKLS